MKLRTPIVLAAGLAAVSAFGQGAGSWAGGSDVLALLIGFIGVPVLCVLGLMSALWLLACGHPYLLLVPVGAGVFYLKVWPADFCTSFNPCTDGQLILGFFIGFVPVSIVVWLIARIALPQRHEGDAT